MAVDLGLHYSVEVKSRFQLFLEDENDSEHGHIRDSSKIEEPVEKKPSTESQQKRANQRNNVTADRGRGASTRSAAPSSRNPPATGGAAERIVEHQKDENRAQRHRGHVAPHHGREFDRKSGSDKTGVKPVPKKDGYGKGNWGTVDDEIDVTMADKNDELEASKENIEEQSQGPAEPPTLTLDEYKAMKKFVASQDSGRTANDGKDVFKDMKLIKSNKPTAEVEAPKFASVYHTPNDSGIALTISHRSAPAPRGAFRGRGGDRPRRGRGVGGERADRPPREREERTDRPPREQRDDAPPRGARPPRGAPRGGAGSAPGRGAPRGGAPRGGRGGAPSSAEPRDSKKVFNEKDFPALG